MKSAGKIQEETKKDLKIESTFSFGPQNPETFRNEVDTKLEKEE